MGGSTGTVWALPSGWCGRPAAALSGLGLREAGLCCMGGSESIRRKSSGERSSAETTPPLLPLTRGDFDGEGDDVEAGGGDRNGDSGDSSGAGAGVGERAAAAGEEGGEGEDRMAVVVTAATGGDDGGLLGGGGAGECDAEDCSLLPASLSTAGLSAETAGEEVWSFSSVSLLSSCSSVSLPSSVEAASSSIAAAATCDAP